MNSNRSGTLAGVTRLIVVLLLAAVVLPGCAAAGIFTVDIPTTPLTPGETTVIPVYLNDAGNVAGFQLYITDGGSAADMHIRADSSDINGMHLNIMTNKAVLYPDGHVPLSGDVRIFSIEVTPKEGENVQIAFDVVEVLDEATNDVTASYLGLPCIIPVIDGQTVQKVADAETTDGNVAWVYDRAQGLTLDDPTVSSQWTGSPTQSVPSALSTAKAKQTGKSPGFLPLTVAGAFALAGFVVACRRRGRV